MYGTTEGVRADPQLGRRIDSEVIDETPAGVWVTGLAGPVRVIVVGQSYVSEGQRVRLASR